MNIKKILIAMLGIAGSAVWIPQAFDQFQDKPSPIDEYPDPPVNEIEETRFVPSDPRAAAPLNEESESAGVSVIADLTGSSSQELMHVLEAFRGPTDRSDLEALLGATPQRMTVSDANIAGNASIEDAQVAPSAATVAAPLMTTIEVDAFVSKLHVNAIIRSTRGDWALIDGRIVQPGDDLLLGKIQLTAVLTGGLQLTTPDGPRRLLLPALDIRAQVSDDSEQAANATKAAAAISTPEPQPQPASNLTSIEELVNQLSSAANREGGAQ